MAYRGGSNTLTQQGGHGNGIPRWERYTNTAGLQLLVPTRTPRLTNQFFIDVPRFAAGFGKRLFSYLATTVWNRLPLNIRLSQLTHFRHRQMPPDNSPFQKPHLHPYHAAHLVTASASDSVSLTECMHVINA